MRWHTVDAVQWYPAPTWFLPLSPGWTEWGWLIVRSWLLSWVLSRSLSCSLGFPVLGEVSCCVIGQPWGEAHMGSVGSRCLRPVSGPWVSFLGADHSPAELWVDYSPASNMIAAPQWRPWVWGTQLSSAFLTHENWEMINICWFLF